MLLADGMIDWLAVKSFASDEFRALVVGVTKAGPGAVITPVEATYGDGALYAGPIVDEAFWKTPDETGVKDGNPLDAWPRLVELDDERLAKLEVAEVEAIDELLSVALTGATSEELLRLALTGVTSEELLSVALTGATSEELLSVALTGAASEELLVAATEVDEVRSKLVLYGTTIPVVVIISTLVEVVEFPVPKR
ncbi:hypothetical protein LTR08_004744 [Meristemomyces frigidus]|nr:hypothetical protein LTR08_004744 [Meristemomyces frigidus]